MSSDAQNNGLSNLTPKVTTAVVDIVFVHGLRGHGEATWTHKYGTFWPKDFLAQDIKNARILTWSYASEIMRFWTTVSTNDIDGYSENLCADLANLRNETESNNRPIIFVAHSLGGLVCANALTLSTNHTESHVRDIATHTRGVVFLGTPHAGSDLAKWAETGIKFLKLDGNDGKATRDISVLKRESGKLSDISTAFGRLLRNRGESKDPAEKINIVCFYEEQDTTIAKLNIGKVVSKASASLSGYETVGISEDHRDMVRFKSKDEVGYKRVSGSLKKWVNDLGDRTPEIGSGDKIDMGGNVFGQQIGKISAGTNKFQNNYGFGNGLDDFLKQTKPDDRDTA